MRVWNRLARMSGQDCYTTTQNLPAGMVVHKDRVTIHYRSRRTLDIARKMVEDAWEHLGNHQKLTVGEAFDITQNKDRTDRILAILNKLDNVESTRKPRELHYRPK